MGIVIVLGLVVSSVVGVGVKEGVLGKGAIQRSVIHQKMETYQFEKRTTESSIERQQNKLEKINTEIENMEQKS